jgi:hypothetical protein
LLTEIESLKRFKIDDATARSKMEDFAMQIFQRADEVDRAGNADKSTAQSFYAASLFLESLKQFIPGKELEEDLRQTQLYCKFKATTIMKAIKEGRKPTPGGDASGHEAGEDDHSHHDEAAAAPPQPSYAQVAAPAPPQSSAPPPPSYAAAVTKSVKGAALTTLNKDRKQDALQYLASAKVAVEKDSVEVAIQRLESALKLMYAD